jgi:hypothetical protein
VELQPAVAVAVVVVVVMMVVGHERGRRWGGRGHRFRGARDGKISPMQGRTMEGRYQGGREERYQGRDDKDDDLKSTSKISPSV